MGFLILLVHGTFLDILYKNSFVLYFACNGIVSHKVIATNLYLSLV